MLIYLFSAFRTTMKTNAHRRFTFCLPLLAVALLVACDKAPQSAPPGPLEVGVHTLKETPLQLDTDLPGRTAAYRIAEVRPQVNGIVQKRLFEEGAEIREGQQLYQIDPATYEAQVARTKASLESTRLLAERYAALLPSKAISQQQHDDAQSAWRQASAAADMAAIDLRYTRVLAPISGRIGRSLASEGALVAVGQPMAMATIQQIDPIYVDVTQSSADILKLKRDLASGRSRRDAEKSRSVQLFLEDGSEYEHAGKLKLSEIGVDQGTGSVTIRAIFPNPDGKLQPGMFVHARLTTGTRANALLAPQQAVFRNSKGLPMAWVIGEDNVANMREIETARTVGNTWLIDKGLQAGERVVTEGVQKLRPGMKVSPVDAGNVRIKTDLSGTEAEKTTAKD